MHDFTIDESLAFKFINAQSKCSTYQFFFTAL